MPRNLTQKQLGRLIARYPVQPLRWRHLLTTFLPLILLVVAPVGYGLWRTYYGYTNFGPAAARFWGRQWFLAGGMLVLLLLFYALRRLYRAHYWAEIRTGGLFLHLASGKKRMLPWEQLWGVTHYANKRSLLGLFPKTTSSLIIYPLEGKPIRLHKDIKDVKGLTKTIKKEVYRRVKPTFREALKVGKKVPFGAVSLNKDSLFFQDREIPWHYLEGISVQEGKLIFQISDAQGFEIPVKKIQNIELLVHFIETEI